MSERQPVPCRNIAVVGQGYVGLPLALHFANNGFRVFGIDVDPGKIGMLRSGQSYLPDVRDEEITRCVDSGRYCPTVAPGPMASADAIIVCVPTPLDARHLPDITILEKAVASVGDYLRSGQLVILESSTYPGTTREVIKPLLEARSGMAAGTDFYIGYSPERIDPGNKYYKVEQIPKIVSGLTPSCLQRVQALYREVFETVVCVSSTEVAEFTKLLENSHRFINISFMNEMATVCDALHIDVWEVIEAAKTKPFGFMPYYPGPGVGGHCIPVDPLYLQWKAEQAGTSSKFIQLSNDMNRLIPAYVANRVKQLLQGADAREAGGGAEPEEQAATAEEAKEEPEEADDGAGRKRILLYGVAYKKDVNDVRESPAIELIGLLTGMGFAVSYHDPFIPEIVAGGAVYASVALDEQTLRNADGVVIFTDHTGIPVEMIVAHARLVFDTRNATAEWGGRPHVYRIGAGKTG